MKGNLVQLGFKVDWAEIGKTRMESGAVIEGLDVVEYRGASLGAGGEPASITVSSCGLSLGLVPSPLSVKSGQPHALRLRHFTEE